MIGAGAAGLVATRELLREGHHVTAFEQNDNVGGIWDFQEECETEDLLGRNPNRRHVHSSMYVTNQQKMSSEVLTAQQQCIRVTIPALPSAAMFFTQNI